MTSAFIVVKTDYLLVYDWSISACITNVNLLLIEELATWTRFSEAYVETYPNIVIFENLIKWRDNHSYFAIP